MVKKKLQSIRTILGSYSRKLRTLTGVGADEFKKEAWIDHASFLLPHIHVRESVDSIVSKFMLFAVYEATYLVLTFCKEWNF